MRRPLAHFWTHCLLALGLSATGTAWAVHAYSQFGDVRYPAGFAHFSYVNPAAPKGGEIVLVPPTRQSNFRQIQPLHFEGQRSTSHVGHDV